ncbi:zinc-finger-containing protein [uncultured Marinobacter sp.]|uniref:zinc-finger-containing protein n=1 Tax=uncultured Marinobacter sp. TaxID=187379 RepID=UPI00258624E2|nr:zinc-finger-containing protein [uncultured Marinobacter sp.]
MGVVDARAYAEHQIAPPAPLPHVSRKALRRVKDPLPIPTDCRYCGMDVKLVNHAEIYGREYGDWPYAYLCRNCSAYVGLHPNTDLPLGTLADRYLRSARKVHKAYFQALQRKAGWTRKEAYTFLAGQMGLPLSECHWGWFEIEDCEKAGAICRDKLEELRHGRH